MSSALRLIAVAVALGSTLFWLAAGANRGWTKTSIPKKIIDDVTGIEGISYEKSFVPGIELLGAAWLGAGVLAGASLLFRARSRPSKQV
jgi:hypothetical protein